MLARLCPSISRPRLGRKVAETVQDGYEHDVHPEGRGWVLLSKCESGPKEPLQDDREDRHVDARENCSTVLPASTQWKKKTIKKIFVYSIAAI